jgi:hypothetical protein
VYEYRYEFNTETLIENHYIVLDSIGDRLRGWYYGTSDEFDSAREGYPPGFFVGEMEGLSVSDGRISFALRSPVDLFTRPIPLQYRSPSEIRHGGLERWPMSVANGVKTYGGTLTPHRITLTLERGERVFTRALNHHE